MSASKSPKPSIIHEQIGEASIQYKMVTGRDPKAVYLGRKEMALLIMWAIDAEYLDPDTPVNEVNIEGESRPEVSGLLVFQVNADRHLGFGG